MPPACALCRNPSTPPWKARTALGCRARALADSLGPFDPRFRSTKFLTLGLAPGTPPATNPVPAVTAPPAAIAEPDAVWSFCLAMVDSEGAQVLLHPVPGAD